MAELSNLLSQRLAAAEAQQVHPDADTLTAYMERLLPAVERHQVLEHISACSQCREVMALSLPEQPVAAVDGVAVAGLAGARRKRFFWTPAFGLAASVAAVAIVAVLMVELPHTSNGRLEQQKQQSPVAPVTSADKAANDAISSQPDGKAEAPATVASAGAVSTLREEDFRSGDRLSALKDKKAAPPSVKEAAVAGNGDSAAVVARMSRRDYMNVQMFAADAETAETGTTAGKELPGAPAPHIVTNQFSANQFKGGPSNATQLTVFADLPSQTPDSKTVRSATPTSVPGHPGFPFLSVLGREAKQLFQKKPTPAISSSSYTFTAMGGAGQLNPALEKNKSSEIAAAAPALEKPEAGDLDQSHAFSRRARSESGLVAKMAKKDEAPQLSWKITSGKLLKSDDSGAWVEAYSGAEGIEFSVVSAHGLEVWAGGSHAALVHSQDGGATWERLRLASWASGTITAIAANGLNVQVRTSENQTCSSQDGGKTWILQN